MVAQELDVGTINQELAFSLLLKVLVAAERGEAPVLGDNNLLATGELVLRAAEGLEGVGTDCNQVSISAALTRASIITYRNHGFGC